MDTKERETEGEAPYYKALSRVKKRWIDEYFVCGMNQTEASRRMGYQAPEQHGWRMSKNVEVKAAIRERLAALEIDANEVLFRMQERARASASDFLTFQTRQYREKVWVTAEEAIRQLRKEIEIESAVAARLSLSGEAMEAVDKQIDDIERRIVRLEVKQEKAGKGEVVHVLVDGPLVSETEANIDLAHMREAGKLHLVKSVKRDKDGALRIDLYDAHSADTDLGKHLGLFGPDGSKDNPIHTHHTIEIINEPRPTSRGNLDPAKDA